MKLYDTLTKKKIDFVPLKKGQVTMYVCGPTVYNYIHVGNARPLVVFDTLRRYFKYIGYDVKLLVNFTDIDDKMINKAKAEGKGVFSLDGKMVDAPVINRANKILDRAYSAGIIKRCI